MSQREEELRARDQDVRRLNATVVNLVSEKSAALADVDSLESINSKSVDSLCRKLMFHSNDLDLLASSSS